MSIELPKINWKKIIIYIAGIILGFAVLYLASVGLLYLVFNVVLHRDTNWWSNRLSFLIALALTICGSGFAIWTNRNGKSGDKNSLSGMLSDKEWKKIGSAVVPIADASPTKGWILDCKSSPK